MTMVIAMMVVGGVNVVVWGPHPTADTKPLKNVEVSTWAQTCPLCSSSLSEDEIVKSHENIKTQKELRNRRPDHPRRSDVATVQPAGQWEEFIYLPES